MTAIQGPSSEPVGESATDALNDAPGPFPHTPDATLEGYEWPEVTPEQLAAADELTRMAYEDGFL